MLTTAIRAGHLRLVIWLVEAQHHPPSFNHNKAINVAVAVDALHIAQWLVESGGVEEFTAMAVAIRYEHSAMLQWLIDRSPNLVLDVHHIVEESIRGGQLKPLQMLHAQTGVVEVRESWVVYAAKKGHWEVLKWMHKAGVFPLSVKEPRWGPFLGYSLPARIWVEENLYTKEAEDLFACDDEKEEAAEEVKDEDEEEAQGPDLE